LFARGDTASVLCLMKVMDRFSKMSGLMPNISKSTIFFCNVRDHVKTSILNSLSFKEGVLPIRYLGVPLISANLRYRDCNALIEAVDSRI
jgi:hypothetical protein